MMVLVLFDAIIVLLNIYLHVFFDKNIIFFNNNPFKFKP